MIRFSSLGDILLTAPAFRALRARFPSAHIDFLVAREYENAAVLVPGPDRILAFDRSRGFRGLWRLRQELSRRYALLIDLQNSPRSAFLRLTTLPTLWTKARRYRLRRWLLIRFKWNLYRQTRPVSLRYLASTAAVGAQDDGHGLQLHVPAEAREWATVLLKSFGVVKNQFVALCPGARHATKRWPEERWGQLAVALRQSGMPVVIIGAPDEEKRLEGIATRAGTRAVISHASISQVAAVFQRSAAVVCHDSGLMHLATGVGRPVIAIFGPTVEEFGFYPFRAGSEVIENTLPCRPCSALGNEECPKGHFRCMLDTSTERVFAAIQQTVNSADSFRGARD